MPRASIEFFDQSTGELQLATSGSRLPQIIEYSLIEENQSVIENRSHTLAVSDLRIMLRGDSITHGIDFHDGVNDIPALSERVGYRLSLYDSLTAEGVSFDFVGQLGHPAGSGQRAAGSGQRAAGSGQRAAGSGAGLPDPDNNGYSGVDIDFIDNKLATLLPANHPDVILMMIGTNFTPTTAQSIDAIVNRLDSWAQENTPVSLLAATLVPKRDPAKQEVVDVFNADLRSRVQQLNSQHVVLVEQAHALTDADISTEALGVHPNP